MKKTIELRGVYTALITPFNQDGTVDFVALKDLVEWQINEGIDGLVPMGTTGESPTVNHDEHCKIIQTVIEQTNGRVPIIAGTGSNSTQESIDLSKKAKSLGATACLQVTPYYNKPSQEGLYRHFITIAEESELPQLLYNIPGRTSKLIELDTMLRLFQHPLVLGVKEATGNIDYTINLIEKNQEVSVLSGDDSLVLSLIAQGGHGVVSVLSNIAPKKVVEMTHCLLQNDIAKGRELFYTLYPLMKAMFIDTNPIPIKYVATKIGLCKEVYRLPLCELNSKHKTYIDALLKSLNITR